MIVIQFDNWISDQIISKWWVCMRIVLLLIRGRLVAWITLKYMKNIAKFIPYQYLYNQPIMLVQYHVRCRICLQPGKFTKLSEAMVSYWLYQIYTCHLAYLVQIDDRVASSHMDGLRWKKVIPHSEVDSWNSLRNHDGYTGYIFGYITVQGYISFCLVLSDYLLGDTIIAVQWHFTDILLSQVL